MSTPRDYGGTGATNQGGRKYISIEGKNTDTAYLEFQDNRVGSDGKPYTAFSGYFDGIEVSHRAASIEHDLPEREEIKIALTVMEKGKEQTYLIGMSSHWKNPAVGQAINALAGAHDLGGNLRDMRLAFSVWMKTKPGKRPSLQVSLRKDGQFLPQRFPFDKDTQSSPGVPPLNEQTEFWLKIARELEAAYPVAVAAGTVSEPEPGPATSSAPAANIPPANTPPPPPAQLPAPPPSVSAPDAGMRKMFADYLSEKLLAIKETDPGLVATELRLVFANVAQKKDGTAFYERGQWSLDEVLKDIRYRYVQITGDEGCTISPVGVIFPSVKNSDDLPF